MKINFVFREPLKTANFFVGLQVKMLIYLSKLRFSLARPPRTSVFLEVPFIPFAGTLNFLFCISVFVACNGGNGTKGNGTPPDSIAKSDSSSDIPVPIPLDETAVKLTDIAKFLAGLVGDSGSPMALYRNTQHWENHRIFNDTIWTRIDQEQLMQVRDWGDDELSEIRKTSRNIFYPFSGPDFLYGHVIYPQGNYFILTGLEPVGHVPEMDKIPADKLPAALRALQVTLDDILLMSFFKTNDMAVDLRYNELKGTIPVIMLFMARTGHDVLSVEHVRILKNGELHNVSTSTPDSILNKIPGARIRFVEHNGAEIKELYYFSLHLEDGVLPTTPEFNRFVEKKKDYLSYLKGASYLMHKDYFSTIRNLIMDNSLTILEDDSGIAYRYFDRNKWTISLYGNYVGPIPLFAMHYQNDLAAAYQSDSARKDLAFGLGYQYQVSKSNLLLARKK